MIRLAYRLLALTGAWLAILAPSARAQAPIGPLDCVMEPAQRVKIGSATLGVLKSVAVNRGDIVKAGQIIARLDTSVEEANLALAEAQAKNDAPAEAQRARVELYRRRLERQNQLSKGVATQDKVDQVEADHEIGKRDLQTEILKHDLAVLDVDRARAQLDLRIIRSPFDGLVFERLMSAGEFVRQDSAIFTLVQLDPLYVEAYVGVGEWNRLKLGASATVSLDAPIGGSYPAKVTVIDHVFDAASGTFSIRLELPNPENRLPAGQRCKVRIEPATD